jgi:hypothetical protein
VSREAISSVAAREIASLRFLPSATLRAGRTGAPKYGVRNDRGRVIFRMNGGLPAVELLAMTLGKTSVGFDTPLFDRIDPHDSMCLVL